MATPQSMEALISISWRTVILYMLILQVTTSEYLVQFSLPDNNSPQKTPIGNIITNMKSFLHQGPYRIITKKYSYPKFYQYFRILNTGDIFLLRPLDRDDINNVCGPLLCCDKAVCTIEIQMIVTLQRTNQRFNVKVLVEIIDENDNSPTFNVDSFAISILENEKLFTRYRLPLAVDIDSPSYQIKTYTLSGRWGDSFSLKLDNGEPFLIPKKSFDYEDESQRKFECHLTAEDHGGKTGVLGLHITIVDINDNSPSCLDNTANISVIENTTYTKSIYDFRASDPDSGNNGKITFSFSTTTMPLIKETFRLDNDTGSLFLTKKLDFELYSEQNFKITIQVSDNGLPPLSDFCAIEIHVSDLNDNSPVVDLVMTQPVVENVIVKETVVKFYVRDEDTSDNDVSCRTDNFSPGLLLVQEEKSSYIVQATGMYDREKTNNLTMLLVCQDSGPSPQVTEHLLTIPIKDKNDNIPIFHKSIYEVLVPEDFPLLKSFITLKASDLDADEFGTIKYELGWASREQFAIDAESGEVTLVKFLDRELKSTFNITVIAVDGGNLRGYSYIELSVSDVNDNGPILIKGTVMNVSENVPRGSVVGYFLVGDMDLAENGIVTWRHELIGNATFLLDVDNCTIMTAAEIDRENQDYLYVHVIMTDRGSPPLTSTATVTVCVVDENDNIPEVIHPIRGAILDDLEGTSVPTNAPRYSHVVTIKSHDPDIGINGHVLYDMLPSNGSKYFKINRTDGQVLTNWAYDSISFTPTHPKEGLYQISYSIYNEVRSSTNMSTSTASFFFVRVIPYRHFISNEIFQQQHRRPFFNNVVLLILIGGFTISLSAALIAAIVWAKSKYSSESSNLEQAQTNDGKFMMMMMLSGEPQHCDNSFVYDPYSSLMRDHDRGTDNGYQINHSRSSTFNTRRTGREHALWNHYENKTVPRNIVQPEVGRNCASDVFNNSYSLSTTDLANGPSTTDRQPKLTNSFYRHFEHDTRCHSPILQSTNRQPPLENQYGSISPMRASICDPTPNIATTSNWVPRVPPSGDDTTSSYTMC